MKVLVINKMYHPDIGGVETVVKQYSEKLSGEHQVTVLTVKKARSMSTETERINNVLVVRCSSFGTFFSMPVSLSFFFQFFRLRNKADIVHFHEPFPLASLVSVFRKGQKKYIVTWHSDIIKQKFLKKAVELFQRKLCSKADIITTTSEALKMKSSVIAGFKDKVRTVPLSININNYLPVNGDNDRVDKGYILFLGRLAYYKGIRFLLEAYKVSKHSLPLKIFGDGEESVFVEQFIEENKGLPVTFMKAFVSEEEKKKLLRECSFFVMPSVFSSEAFGIMQLEAMVYRKPVINTNLPTGVPWVSLDSVSGITVEPFDVEALRDAINLLSEQPELRKKLGDGARERVVGMFSDDVILQEISGIFASMV